MSDNPLRALELELVAAAARRPRGRVGSRRTALLVVFAAVVLVAIPAWATGVLRGVFPETRHPLPGVGRAFVAASGTTARGERWRFELIRGTRFRDHRATGTCWGMQIGDRPGFGICSGGIGTTGYERHISRRDPRQMIFATVPLRVATVAVRFRSGREVRVRPLVPDQAMARRTGVPFRGGSVAIAFGTHDRVERLVFLDAAGRPVGPASRITPPFTPRRDTRIVQSPAI